MSAIRHDVQVVGTEPFRLTVVLVDAAETPRDLTGLAGVLEVHAPEGDDWTEQVVSLDHPAGTIHASATAPSTASYALYLVDVNGVREAVAYGVARHIDPAGVR